MKSAVEINRLLLKFVLLCQVDIQENTCKNNTKIQFPRDNLGEQKVLESVFFRLSKDLKPKMLVTRVPPPGYTWFMTNLPF